MKITSLESGYVAPEDTTTLFMEGVAGDRSWGGSGVRKKCHGCMQIKDQVDTGWSKEL